MKLISLLLFLALSWGGFSQFYKPTSISLKSRGGYLIAHRAIMSHLIQNNNYGFELEFSKQRKEQESWKDLRMPVSGLSILFQDFGYRSVLGQTIGVFQHYSQPLVASPKYGFLDLRFGSGVAYISKKYDPLNNPKNNAIGSHINAVIDVQLAYKKHLGPIHLGMGIGITHFSNAALLQPNLGLNTPYLDFTIGYNFDEREVPLKESIAPEVKKEKLNSTFAFTGIGSSRQNLAGQNLPKSYPVIALQGYYSFALGNKWKWDVGTDLIYNESNRYFFPDEGFTSAETIQWGLFTGSTVRLHKTEIFINVGYYLLNKINHSGNVYNRIGYRYLFNKYLYGLVGIKAHFGKADYIEFGIGVRFLDR
ncbi:MAG: acyloxyacyl hydrolase [Flavobacteriales bacterium]|nr:acyloxyacyl hydrolase [Flavobacteriales bacterium]